MLHLRLVDVHTRLFMYLTVNHKSSIRGFIYCRSLLQFFSSSRWTCSSSESRCFCLFFIYTTDLSCLFYKACQQSEKIVDVLALHPEQDKVWHRGRFYEYCFFFFPSVSAAVTLTHTKSRGLL